MSGRRDKVEFVVYTEMFWNDLEKRRSEGGYLAIRSKAEQLIRHRLTSDMPMPREKVFTEGPLAGLWHCHLSKTPHAVLIYGFENGALIAHKIADHRDYSWNGKGMRSDSRTRAAIDRSNKTDVASPLWETTPRWRSPESLLTHPDLPELAPAVLQELLNEVEDEALDPRRFATANGRALRTNSKEEDDYLESMINLADTIQDMIVKRYGAHYDQKTGWTRHEPKP